MNITTSFPASVFAWLIAAVCCWLASELCEFAETQSRGKGTWNNDRQLLRLSGAMLWSALICAGLALHTVVEWFIA